MQQLAKLVNGVKGAHFRLPESKYQLQRVHKPIFDYELHYKCQKCKKYTALHSSIQSNQLQCNVANCGVTIKKAKDNFFVYIPLEQQLRVSIKRHFDSIMRYRNREKTEESIADVHEGNICKQIDSMNPNSTNLKFVMNTDGAQIFKSTTLSLWPVLLYQNFLPPRLRFIPTNMLVVALYFGNHKMDMHEYLFPFIKELSQLQKSGIIIESVAKEMLFKPFISNCACDLPARAAVQSLMQYNGKGACGYCFHPGVSVQNEKGNKQCRYVKRIQPEIPRTHRNMVETMAKVPEGGCIDGVKGLSPLVGLIGFDLVHGFSIDYMHCIAIGVTSALYTLWMDSKNSKKPFYINKQKQKILNNRITSIRPPSWITSRSLG